MPGEKHMKTEPKKKQTGLALPLILIVVVGVGSFFIQLIFNKGPKKKECDYSTVLYPAEVIGTDTVNPGYCEFTFRVEKEGVIDTVFYSAEFGGYASFDQIQKKHIIIGEKFQFAVQKLNTEQDECPPLVEVLLLEKY